MPYHRYQDHLEEAEKENKIGTTGRGIGPAYADKYARRGLRFHEFMDLDSFLEKLKTNLAHKTVSLQGYTALRRWIMKTWRSSSERFMDELS